MVTFPVSIFGLLTGSTTEMKALFAPKPFNCKNWGNRLNYLTVVFMTWSIHKLWDFFTAAFMFCVQDLLQLQYEGVAVMKMFDKAKVNVNLLIFLLNKKFYGKWKRGRQQEQWEEQVVCAFWLLMSKNKMSQKRTQLFCLIWFNTHQNQTSTLCVCCVCYCGLIVDECSCNDFHVFYVKVERKHTFAKL